MTISDFEEAVWLLEGIRLVIREAGNTQIADYDYDRAAYSNHSVSHWLRNRVYPRLDGREVIVLSGYGEIPHGRMRLDNLRATYEETMCE